MQTNDPVAGDYPELMAKGRRCLAWLVGGAGLFVIAATFTLHVAQERHERALMKTSRTAYAATVGAEMARYFPDRY